MLRKTSLFDENFPALIASLAEDTQFEIVRTLWPEVIDYGSFDALTYKSFFENFRKQIGTLHHRQQYFAIQNLDGVFEVVAALRERFAVPQERLAQTIATQYPNASAEAIRRSLELTVRIWLTLNVNSPSVPVGPTFADETPLNWDAEQSLKALVESQYSISIGARHKSPRSKIDPSLTAAHLASTCGLQLRWTDSLTDHLRFDSRNQVLAVYRHKICIFNHIQSKGDCPIPKVVLKEILDTLNLLFPFGDVATKQLLIKENQRPLYQLGSCGRPRDLDLNHYEYFREELEYLIESFNRPPRTWKQLATDRRNKMEWTLFWATVMVWLAGLYGMPTALTLNRLPF